MTRATVGTPAGRRASLIVRMGNAARESGVVARRIHLVVAIDRLLVRRLEAAPGGWVVKGGYANQLRRPDDARLTEDLDLRIDAAIETAPELLASGFATDLADDFSYEVAASPAPLDGPPGGLDPDIGAGHAPASGMLDRILAGEVLSAAWGATDGRWKP